MTYILLPLVALIWGIIFFRIFSSFNEPIIDNQFHDVEVKTNETLAPDTFHILADYRDPFLGNVISTNESSQKNTEVKKIVTVPKPIVQAVKWPSVVYGGIIKNQKSQKQLVMMQVGGQDNLMRQGDEKGGVQLVKIYKDSIEVSFQKEKKIIRK